MSYLKHYMLRQRRLVIFRLATIAMRRLGALTILAGIIGIVLLHPHRSTSSTSLDIQLTISILNSVLAAVLVVATLVYVRLTRATLSELVRSRTLSRRPNIVLTLDPPAFQNLREFREIKCKLTLANHGATPAIRFRCDVASIRGKALSKNFDECEWLDGGHGGRISELPSVLVPGASASCEVEGLFPIFDLPLARLFTFLEFSLEFEDVDGSSYEVRQCYDLYNNNGLDHCSWGLNYDALLVGPAMDTLPNPSTGQRQVIYERAGYLPHEAWVPKESLLSKLLYRFLKVASRWG
jgi:hypothetical protein